MAWGGGRSIEEEGGGELCSIVIQFVQRIGNSDEVDKVLDNGIE